MALAQPEAGRQVTRPALATKSANVPSAGQAPPASAHPVFVRKKGVAGRAEASNVSFLPAVTYVTGGPQTNASSPAVADVNGDGKPDLIVANVVTSCCGGVESIGVLLGNGDGTFQSPIVITSVSQIGEFNALAVADVNRDGKPDLIVTTCCATAVYCVFFSNWIVNCALQVLARSSKAEPWRSPCDALKNSPRLVRLGNPVKRALPAALVPT